MYETESFEDTVKSCKHNLYIINYSLNATQCEIRNCQIERDFKMIEDYFCHPSRNSL